MEEDEHSEQGENTENPFGMLLGGTLGASSPENPDNWPSDVNSVEDGNYLEPAPKTNIRPYYFNGGEHVWGNSAKHIYNSNDVQVMKVVYVPEDTSSAKVVWREDEVVVDGKTYTYVEIGDLCWTQQNLAVTSTITIDTKNKSNYPNHDASQVEKYGIMYNASQVASVNAVLPYPWRVATLDDWNSMVAYVNNKMGSTDSNVGQYLVATNGGSKASYCGTDDFGLYVYDLGRNNGGSTQKPGRDATFRLGGESSTTTNVITFDSGRRYSVSSHPATYCMPIRIVRQIIEPGVSK